MAILDFQTIMRPLLVALKDGQEPTSTEIRAALAASFSLTEEELAEMIPSGRAKTFANRVAWAMTHMYQAGLLERPRRWSTESRHAAQKYSPRNPIARP